MTMYPQVQLQAGKEANVGFRHPWVFSGAIARIPEDLEHGAMVSVVDRRGEIIGTGTYSNKSSIAVRVLAFKDCVIDQAWFVGKIRAAEDRRRVMGYGPSTDTTGYRVLFGESDGVPGLVVDRFEDVVVFQIATAGLDAMRDVIVAALVEALAPRALIERSDIASRREEGLPESVGVRHGEAPGLVTFKENGLVFVADVLTGQKTGFFLDQKDLRAAIQNYAKGAKVLNLFSHSGATGIAAMAAGAERVHNVDGSDEALVLLAKNAELNKINPTVFTSEKSDVFQWIGVHAESAYDMVIIDPPALIKKMSDTEEGRKAYHFLNRAAMKLVKNGGILVTSSCSHFFPEEDLAFVLRRASVQASLDLSVLSVARQSPDHPVSVYFPEAQYLKTFLCQVVRL